MIDLERDLRELGEHLDHPAGEQIIPQLRRRLAAPTANPVARRRSPRRRAIAVSLVSVAAAVLVAVAIILGLGSA